MAAATKYAPDTYPLPSATTEAAAFARVVRDRRRDSVVTSRNGNERPSRGPRPIRTGRPPGADHLRASSDVARVLAQIMAERHPGTRWLPVERDERGHIRGVATGKVIRLFAGPEDHDPL